MSTPPTTHDTYLGDGVYAWFDGYRVWLDLRAQVPTCRIALEPTVLEAFDAFRAMLQRRLTEGAQEEKP